MEPTGSRYINQLSMSSSGQSVATRALMRSFPNGSPSGFPSMSQFPKLLDSLAAAHPVLVK
jgi:hypothetical protein